MKVLIACEFSGTVRDEFIKLGHDAVSCDLLPSMSKYGPHIQGDVLDVIGAESWDLMIAHPPCRYLTVAANRALKEQGKEREREREMAFKFALNLYNAPIPRICLENPVGYLNSHFRKADQIIHPWMFGDCEMKRTCLWLKNLPKLYYSSPNPRKPKRDRIYADGNAVYWHDTCKRGKNGDLERWQARAKFFPGIAHAMAVQWGSEKTQYFTESYGGSLA